MSDDRAKRRFEKRIAGGKGDATKILPAATVSLLRDRDDGFETLMLRKNSKIAFGGMWVFPGGRVDDQDGEPGDEPVTRARIAAVREAEEEASLKLDPADLVWFSHWTPPPIHIRRYSTWFFAARTPASDVTIDDGEITESQWIRPGTALAKRGKQEIELVPPTLITLHYLSGYETVDAALAGLAAGGVRHYVTRVAPSDEGAVLMWEGDAGYTAVDASIEGPRHRLTMTQEGFCFDDSGLR